MHTQFGCTCNTAYQDKLQCLGISIRKMWVPVELKCVAEMLFVHCNIHPSHDSSVPLISLIVHPHFTSGRSSFSFRYNPRADKAISHQMPPLLWMGEICLVLALDARLLKAGEFSKKNLYLSCTYQDDSYKL